LEQRYGLILCGQDAEAAAAAAAAEMQKQLSATNTSTENKTLETQATPSQKRHPPNNNKNETDMSQDVSSWPYFV